MNVVHAKEIFAQIIDMSLNENYNIDKIWAECITGFAVCSVECE